MLPIVQALKAAGNRVITVLAGRTKELIILEKEMRDFLNHQCDGSLYRVGFRNGKRHTFAFFAQLYEHPRRELHQYPLVQ